MQFIKLVILAGASFSVATTSSAHPVPVCNNTWHVEETTVKNSCTADMASAIISRGFDGPVYLPRMQFTDGTTDYILECVDARKLKLCTRKSK